MRRPGVDPHLEQAALAGEHVGNLGRAVEGAVLPGESEVVAPVRVVVEEAGDGIVVLGGEGLVEAVDDGVGLLGRDVAADVDWVRVLCELEVGRTRLPAFVVGQAGCEVAAGFTHDCGILQAMEVLGVVYGGKCARVTAAGRNGERAMHARDSTASNITLTSHMPYPSGRAMPVRVSSNPSPISKHAWGLTLDLTPQRLISFHIWLRLASSLSHGGLRATVLLRGGPPTRPRVEAPRGTEPVGARYSAQRRCKTPSSGSDCLWRDSSGLGVLLPHASSAPPGWGTFTPLRGSGATHIVPSRLGTELLDLVCRGYMH